MKNKGYIHTEDYLTEKENIKIIKHNIKYNLKKGYHSPDGKKKLQENLKKLNNFKNEK